MVDGNKKTQQRPSARPHVQRESQRTNTHVYQKVDGLLHGGHDLEAVRISVRWLKFPPGGWNDLNDAILLRGRSDAPDVAVVLQRVVGGDFVILSGRGTYRTSARGTTSEGRWGYIKIPRGSVATYGSR